MNVLQEQSISCPYCGESIDVLIDDSIDTQRYIEDCQVCCRPITLITQITANGDCQVVAQHEDDA